MFNSKIIKQGDAVLYCMPSLDSKLQNTEMVLEKLQKQAYEEGFASGERAGYSEGEHKAFVLTDRLEKIINEIATIKENTISELETQVVDLAVAIARRIIIEEISTKPEIIVTMVKEALMKLQRMGNITIKINPALHDLFLKRKPEIIEIHQDIIFDVDSNIPVTAPLVISATEEVVTDIDSLLNNVIEQMKQKSLTETESEDL